MTSASRKVAGAVARVSRVWHTVRYLRPVQLYGRVAHRLSRPRADLRSAPARRAVSRAWVPPAERPPTLVGPERFRFLNEEHELGADGWNDARVDRLWRYNLHYFGDLAASDAPSRRGWHRALIERWVRENPPGAPTAWEPYPTSLRIVNWIKWALAGGDLSPEAVHSLAVQSRWLSRRLEHHLLGNHLFSNAKALVFAGLFFEGAEADVWRTTGARLVAREIPEQILRDGGHFERSTMYHALALEDMLDLLNVVRAYACADMLPLERAAVATLSSMRVWAAAMTHPDGEIAFFNDAAIGIAPTPHALEAYAKRLGLGEVTPPGSTQLLPSGYLRIERGPAVALLDVAPLGPDYLPAHGHADTLSFELSLFGHRVFVNSGTSRYGAGAERLRQRGTRAHNTVLVDGADSSEVWGGFRVARRARPVALRVDLAESCTVSCAHDGYMRLRGRVLHRRTWRANASTFAVEDRLSGAFADAEARFHLHPDVSLAVEGERADATVLHLRLRNGVGVTMLIEGGSTRIEPATWHPEFGRDVPTSCIIVRFGGASVTTRLEWGTRS